MTNLQLHQLPEFQALASSLHQGSAAVMVGAGFSRSAAVSADPSQKIPLWKDFAYLLAGDNTSGESLLRLAEGYVALHKRQKLNHLIKEAINDASWQPGELYQQLLQLPWAEVLTTNWDTLLERASKEITTQLYEVVHYPQDLAQVKTPRLTKLHGTLGVTEHLIFTEEDYRTYPNKYAAFVNFTRQVCIENDLCLLGFSGTDPNFLAWIGWVRDHLKDQSRNIYLIGVLKLTSVTRRYYESLNITAIDLAAFLQSTNHNKDQQHLEGLQLTLNSLHELKPKSSLDWQPDYQLAPGHDARQPENDTAWVDANLAALQKEREAYPGWLLCPKSIKNNLSVQLNSWHFQSAVINKLGEQEQAALLYELVWRSRLLNRPLYRNWIKPLFAILAADNLHGLLSTQALEIILGILESLQWLEHSEEKTNYYVKALGLLEKHQNNWPESSEALSYWQAWDHYKALNFKELEQVLNQWQAKLPMWQLRKAGLLAVVGDFDTSALLTKQAYQTLNMQWRNHPESIYLFSRLAWAHWLWRMHQKIDWTPMESWPSASYSAKQCDPWSYIQALDDKLSEAKQKQLKANEIEPRFQPGTYQDKSNSVRLSTAIHPLVSIASLLQTTGVPIRLSTINLFSERIADSLSIHGADTEALFCWAANTAHSETDEVIEKNFSRINIAKLPTDTAATWLERTKNAMDYWLEKRTHNEDKQGFAIMRLRVFTELTARLVIRADADEAISVFKFATGLGHNPLFQHFWLHTPLNNLLTNSLSAIPASRQQEVLLEALEFPLVKDILDFGVGNSWPNPLVNKPGCRRSAAEGVDAAINNLIEQVKITETLTNLIKEPNSKKGYSTKSSESYPHTGALIRLLAVHQADFLLPHEVEKLKTGIWGHLGSEQLLPATGLLSWTLLALPHDATEQVMGLVNAYLYAKLPQQLDDINKLVDVYHSALSPCKVTPNEEQAESILEAILSFPLAKNYEQDFLRHIKKQDIELLSKVLGEVVVAALPKAALTKATLEKLISFIQKNSDTQDATSGLAYFVNHGVETDRILALLRKNLFTHHTQLVIATARAILVWSRLKITDDTQELVDQIINRLIYGDLRIKSALLAIVIELQKDSLLTEQQQKLLAQHLPSIFNQMNYEHLSDEAYQAIQAPLIRRNCLLLAEQLVALGENETELEELIDAGKQDPLPEVRYIG